MIELGMDRLVDKAKKAKKWKPIPAAPRAKFIQVKQLYANNKDIADTLNLYELFRDIEDSEKIRENEFRKGVNLRVTYRGQVININLDKLKEYSATLERFISALK